MLSSFASDSGIVSSTREFCTCSKNVCDKVRQSQNSHKIVSVVVNPSQTILNLVFVRKKVREVWDNSENDLLLEAIRKTFARISCECRNVSSVSQFARNLFAISLRHFYVTRPDSQFAAFGLRSVDYSHGGGKLLT